MKHLNGKNALIAIAMLQAIVIVFAVATYCHAGTMKIYGWTTTETGAIVPGVTVTATLIPPQVVTSNASGYYEIIDNNWCDAKRFVFSKTGYVDTIKNVADGSCPDCPPVDYTRTCRTSIMVNAQMASGTSYDSDGDGVLNSYDNCPTTPNGWKLGTCTTGKRGSPCNSYIDCGCSGVCSKNQQDCDGNGVGDACDICVDQYGTGCSDCNSVMLQGFSGMNPAHRVAAKLGMRSDYAKALLAIFFSTHFNMQFDSLSDFYFFITHLPSFYNMCGGPMIDQNENGIADGEEGLIPEDWTFEDYAEAFQNALQRCIQNDMDPE